MDARVFDVVIYLLLHRDSWEELKNEKISKINFTYLNRTTNYLWLILNYTKLQPSLKEYADGRE